jgi:hypothetical protein
VGEALVSLLDEKGTPGITQRAWMFAPGSQIGPVTPDERGALISKSLVAGVYEKEIDCESVFEKLRERASAGQATSARPVPGGAAPSGSAPAGAGAVLGGLGGLIFGTTGPRGGKRDGLVDILAKTATRTASSTITRQILRGVLGSLSGGRRR